MPESNDLKCTVVSLVPFEINEFKPGLIPGNYHIDAAEADQPEVLMVGTAIHYVYLDDTRGSLQVRTPSSEVAKSIVNDYVGSQLGIDEGAMPALFWLAGPQSVEKVLDEHKAHVMRLRLMQRKWFTNLCRIADDDWTRYQKHTVISDFQRKAALIIGWKQEDHPWMATPEAAVLGPQQKCPSCGNSVPTDVVVCTFCRCILNPEKYKTLTFA